MIDEQSRPLAAEFHIRHCDAEDRHNLDHVCQGKMTITAATCTFECARCGEDRINIAQEVARIRQADFEEREDYEGMTQLIHERFARDAKVQAPPLTEVP